MITAPPERALRGAGLAPAYAATRVRLGLIALLLALAGVSWWWTLDQMHGMDDGPWTDLGSPGLVPRRLGRDDGGDDVPVGRPDGGAVLPHDQGALPALAPCSSPRATSITWGLVGLLAFAIAVVGARAVGDVLSWDRAGRWVAGGTLVARGDLRADPAQGCLPREVPEPARFPARRMARRLVGRAADGGQARRLVRRVLLGPDGVALRARRHGRSAGWPSSPD